MTALGAPPTAAGAQSDAAAMARTRTRAIERAIIETVERARPATVAVFALKRMEHRGASRLVTVSGGSGVIIDDEGLVLTNDHVAGHCDAIEVVLLGGRRLPATLVAVDGKGDIALLDIEGKGFPSVKLGRSDEVEIGEWVLAMGNPFHLGKFGSPVVTVGVVSGKDRVLPGRWEYSGSIQTDAEINPGNSGGPLFDMKGRLIGINGKISLRNRVRANTGVGYAIPIDMIKDFLPILKQGKNIERGYSGITVGDRKEGHGAVVARVDPGSPGAARGVARDDVITRANGKAIRTARDWMNVTSPLTVGRTLSVNIRRKGRSRVVRMELEMSPARRAELERAARKGKTKR